MAELPFVFQQELSAIDLGEEAEASVADFARRHLRRMADLAEKAYEGEGHDFPICRLHPLGRLAVIIWKLPEIRRKYEALGISAEIIRDTFSDISLRQRLFYQKTGKVGLSRADGIWLRHIASAQIFKLGVLQYQPIKMFYLENYENGSPFFVISDDQKAKLPVGTPVVNVHIQAGADLAVERVADSLMMAKDFFPRVFPETRFQALVCYSWLLHSGLQDLLPPNSRILHFAENFEVVSETGDNRQAVERIFGRRYRRRANYPQQTSLQRNALRDPAKLGYALGIIYLD
ncbi:MAG: acyltransferase domain-containing protein [Anaerolineaceae bacterium]